MEKESIAIAYREVVSLEKDVETVRCEEGVLWITWIGGSDIVLYPGNSVSVKGRDRVCVQSMDGTAMMYVWPEKGNGVLDVRCPDPSRT